MEPKYMIVFKEHWDALLSLSDRLVETARVCRGCEWEVEKHELVQLLTSLEKEAEEASKAREACAEGGE